MSLWPFIPDAQIIEALAWRTDVMQARAKEQRVALRAYPRTEFHHRYVFTEREFSRAAALVRSLYGTSFVLPRWPDSMEAGTLTAAQTVLTVDTTNLDLQNGDGVVVWQDSESYEQGTVASFTASSLTLTTGLLSGYSKALVVPTVAAQFADSAAFSRGPHEWTELNAQFVVSGGRDLSANTLYPLYLTHPVITDRSIASGSFDEQLSRRVETLDFELGKIAQFVDRVTPDFGTRMEWFLRSRAELFALRKWLHYCKGRQKQFWVPTWSRDFELTSPIGASDVIINTEAVPLDYPFHIQIELADGTKFYREIVGGDGEAWEMSSSLGVAVGIGSASTISRLVPARFDADRIEVAHSTARQATIMIPLVETSYSP